MYNKSYYLCFHPYRYPQQPMKVYTYTHSITSECITELHVVVKKSRCIRVLVVNEIDKAGYNNQAPHEYHKNNY